MQNESSEKEGKRGGRLPPKGGRSPPYVPNRTSCLHRGLQMARNPTLQPVPLVARFHGRTRTVSTGSWGNEWQHGPFLVARYSSEDTDVATGWTA